MIKSKKNKLGWNRKGKTGNRSDALIKKNRGGGGGTTEDRARSKSYLKWILQHHWQPM